MGRVLLVTDHPGRSRALIRDLGEGTPCDLHDLLDEAAPAGEPASVILADLMDLGSDTVERLRRVRAWAPQGTPLILLLHLNSQRTRLLSVALGATHTLCAPFDLARLRDLIGSSPLQPPAEVEPLAAQAVRTAIHARTFFTSVFVPDRPITPAAIETGTDFIGRAVCDTGIRDWVRAVRRFDDATHQHCLLVAGLAAAFAASLGLGVLIGNDPRPSFAATVAEFGCTNFEAAPPPPKPKGVGFVTIWRGNCVVWEGWEDAIPARFLQKDLDL